MTALAVLWTTGWIIGGVISAFIVSDQFKRTKPPITFVWSPRRIFWTIILGALASPIATLTMVVMSIVLLCDRVGETRFGQWWKRPLGK
jgi:hypothetical protein